MLSILLSALLVIFVESQTFCVWGRDGANNLINGLFTYYDEYNGAPYYRRTITGNSQLCGLVGTYYLRYKDSNWGISNTLSGLNYAYCVAASSSFPSCSGSWLIWENNAWITDSAVSVTAGSCPEWNCNGITVTSSSDSRCNGNYDVVSGTPNAFKKSGSSFWIYYVDFVRYWVCNQIYSFSCFCNIKLLQSVTKMIYLGL